MTTIVRRNFCEQMVEELGGQIARGAFQPGAPLPIEADLAAQFGVSRSVVREAMKSLAARGLVSISPSTGTAVLPRSRWSLFDEDVLNWQSTPKPNRQFLADLLELRSFIEPPAARLAAERANDKDLAAIREGYALMREAVAGRGDYTAADLKFHGAILDACNNQFVQALRTALAQLLQIGFTASAHDQKMSKAGLKLHENVMLAIENRDGNAAAKAVEDLIGFAGKQTERKTR